MTPESSQWSRRRIIGTGLSALIALALEGCKKGGNQDSKKKDLIPEGQKKKAEEKEVDTHTSSNTRIDSDLELEIQNYILTLRKEGKIQIDEKTSWVVYDIERDRSLATINADIPYQAASMIKPLIALAYFHLVQEGKITYGKESKRQMELMIQKSNNTSTNWVMRQVGGPATVERILRENYGDIFKHTSVVEYIPAGGATYKNKASANDYSRFLQALWKNKVPYADEIMRLMNLPGRDRIYTGAKKVPTGTQVCNKTGSTSR